MPTNYTYAITPTPKLGTIFEKRLTKCCDLFKTHKRFVKGGHKISLQLAAKLVDWKTVPLRSQYIPSDLKLMLIH